MVADRHMRDHQGRRITQAAVERGMAVNMVAGAFGMMWFALALGMPLTMFMERLQASGLAVGMSITVQWLAMAMQIPSAFLAERLSRRKTYWFLVVLPHRLLWFVPALIPLYVGSGQTAVAIVLGVVALSSLLAAAGTAPWFSWIVDLVPVRLRGRFWAKRQSVTMVAFVLALLGGGWLLDHEWSGALRRDPMSGFAWVFGIAAVLGCLDLVIHLAVPEPRAPRQGARRGMLSRILNPFRNGDFLWVTLAFGIWSFGMGFVRSFGDIYMKRTFQVSYTELALVAVSASIGTVIAGLGLGKIMDYIGSRTTAIAMVLLAPVSGLVWFVMKPTVITLAWLPGSPSLSQPALLLIAVNLVVGGLYSGVALCQITMCSAATRKEGRTMAMAVHWTAVGLIGALGPIVGGLVMDHVTAHPFQAMLPSGIRWDFIHVLVFAHVAVSWLGALPLLFKVRQAKGELPVRVLAGNPLRVASFIHNLIMLGESVSGAARARAVRRLGRRRSPYAVSELIVRLDDPAADVREEAVVSLGRIGSEDAVDALVAKMEDPDTDLAPLIARALRARPNPRSVEALLRQLQGEDREMQRESARTLGVIGDSRAVRPLRQLLRQTDSGKILAAAAEALARLGDGGAVKVILPRLKTTRQPVLKRSLAVAAGDLLGAPGTFYELLAHEDMEPESGITALLQEMRRSLRRALTPPSRRYLAHLLEHIDSIEDAYADEDWQQIPPLLLTVVVALAALHNGMEPPGANTEELVDVLILRDAQFGVGLWYLDLLRQAADSTPERIDILLGIHFVMRWWLTRHPRPRRQAAWA